MGKLSPENRAQLKKEYPSVKLKVVTVDDSNGTSHDFVFQPLDRQTVEMSAKEVANSPTKAAEIEMVNSCVFGDKTLIANDDRVFLAILPNWSKIQKSPTVELGEL